MNIRLNIGYKSYKHDNSRLLTSVRIDLHELDTHSE